MGAAMTDKDRRVFFAEEADHVVSLSVEATDKGEPRCIAWQVDAPPREIDPSLIDRLILRASHDARAWNQQLRWKHRRRTA